MSKKAFDRIAEGLNEALAVAQGAPVSRKEYDALSLAMTRLTDRIEALEKRHPEPGTWHAHEDGDDTYSS